MEPFQRPDKQWDATEINEQGYRVPIGYCGRVDHLSSSHNSGHPTKQEAINCYIQYLLDVDLMICNKVSNGDKCSIVNCENTEWRYVWVLGETYKLCTKHCNKIQIKQILKALYVAQA